MADEILEAHYIVLRMLNILTGREISDPENISLVTGQDPESLVRGLIATYGAQKFNAAWREASDELRDYHNP